MPVNLAAAALLATGLWAVSTYTMITDDGAPPSELWTVTSSDKNPKHPTLARASVPRTLVSARETYQARQQVALLTLR
jgi:hypothetical protein